MANEAQSTGGFTSTGGGGIVNSVVAGANISVDNADPANPIVSSTADDITVVANYSALPAPATVSGKFYWASNPQGIKWLPGSLGGTYYSAGMYYSNGVSWEFTDIPYQATQAEVNTGINTDKFVTPATLANSTSIVNGSGAANQVTFWSGAKTLTGTANFKFDGTRLGIGVTTPDSELTVSRQTTIIAPPSGTSVHFIGLDANSLRLSLDTHNNAGAGGTAFLGRRSRGTAAIPTATLSGDTILTMNGVGYGTTTFGSISTGLISIKANQNFTDTAQGTYLSFMTTPDNSVTAVETIRIPAAGGLSVLSGGITFTAIAGSISTSTAQPLSLSTNGSARLNISSTGLVGIGLSATKSYLEIKAGTTTIAPLVLTAGINNTSPQAGGIEYDGTLLTFNPSSTRYNFVLNGYGTSGGTTLIGGTGTTDDLIFRTTSGAGATGADFIWQSGNNGATELMRLLNSGNLGIGATTPAYKLTNTNNSSSWSTDVSGIYWETSNTGSYSFSFRNTAATAGLGLRLHTTGTDAASFPLVITSGAGTGTVQFAVTGNGLVGIGMTPANAIDITQSGSNAASNIKVLNANAGNSALARLWLTNGTSNLLFNKYGTGYTTSGAAVQNGGILWEDGAGGLSIASVEASAVMRFYTGGSAVANERMRILSTGNVGIGVTSPTAILHLKAGTATASTAPLKLTSGTNLTTAETGAIEYNGTNLFFTRTGTTRETVWCGNDAAAAPASNTIGVIVDYYGTSATRVLTTPNSWASVNIGGTTYKIPLYT